MNKGSRPRPTAVSGAAVPGGLVKMDLLRRHAFYLICGVAGAGGVALGVTGWRAMPQVLEEMKKAGSVYSDLGGARERTGQSGRD